MNETSNIRENETSETPVKHSLLAEQPQRRNRRRAISLLFVICGCLVILGGGGALIWQLTSHTSTPVLYNSTPASSNASAKQPAGCTAAREPVDVIMQQTAQGLHLTVAQVQARVLAGKTIAQIAAEQGLTPARLHDVEVQALQYANNRWLSMGCTTRQEVQDNLRRDTGSASYMDAEFTGWFKG